jgi:hypothetical protein
LPGKFCAHLPATELLFAFSLLLDVRGFGYAIGLAEILFININVSLLAGRDAHTRGIGVVEGGLAYGLVSAGMPEEAAFAAVLLYRLATFTCRRCGATSHYAGSNATTTFSYCRGGVCIGPCASAQWSSFRVDTWSTCRVTCSMP